VTFGIEPLGHALASPPNRLRIRFSGLGGELRALVKRSSLGIKGADEKHRTRTLQLGVI
jgi:hypothetical protein